MSGPEILIPILVPVSGMAMVLGIVYLVSREKMAMIEKGMNPREFANHPAPYRNLKWGLLLMGAGLGLLLAYILHNHILHIEEDTPVIYFAMLGIFSGLGLFTSYRIEKKEMLDKKDEA